VGELAVRVLTTSKECEYVTADSKSPEKSLCFKFLNALRSMIGHLRGFWISQRIVVFVKLCSVEIVGHSVFLDTHFSMVPMGAIIISQ